MQTKWIVVADAAQARIFHRIKQGSVLEQEHVLTHPESKAHPGDLRTGGKGEVIESTSAASHQSDPQTSTMEKHADIFASEVAEFLRKRRAAGKYDSLVLVAEPQFLGRLRDNLDNATLQIVDKDIDKDWTQHDVRQIARLLENHA